MPATRAPATRDQADAYRFGLRRLEAALVRGDPVPQHEQLRSQRRAALAGVLIGMLALGGVLAFARIKPDPDWRQQSIIVATPSGAVYVVAKGPVLVPVANLLAARLVATTIGNPRGEPTTVTDAGLADAPRGPTAAVPGAVAVAPDLTVAPRWAVCDQDTGSGQVSATTVIGGAAPGPAPAGDAVLLADSDGTTWLATAGHRHRLDRSDGRLLAALGLIGSLPREASAALVSALPEGPPLVVPEVPRRGDPAPGGLPGKVGDVLTMQPGGSDPQYFVVLAAGLQKAPRLVGELLAAASPARTARPVGIDVLGSVAFVDQLRVTGWPGGALHVVEPADAPVVCWTWAGDGPAEGSVWMGPALPATPVRPAPLVQADGPGPLVDAVAVGQGGAVRATGPGRVPGAGPLWLVSGAGVAYGVADDATAAALGITAATPAPEAALRLLPTGPRLDAKAAQQQVDVLPGG